MTWNLLNIFILKGMVGVKLMQIQKLIPLAMLTACASQTTVTVSDCGGFDLCQAKDSMAVLAEAQIAEPILQSAQEGRVAFKRYFGVEAAPIAIVPGGEITADMQRDLKNAGYEASLPWISASDKQLLAESSIRGQIMEQTKGMSTAQREAIIEMALAKSENARSSAADMSATEQGALTHELGHMWFMSAFTPEEETTSKGHGYGGWAPDWLDETAAILLENNTLTESRRNAFKTMKHEDFYPLEIFLTMEHPALKSAQALEEKFETTQASVGSRAIVLSGEEAEEFLKASGKSNPANFYTQARGFADYLIMATGDEQIFANLARYLSGGGKMGAWLAQTDSLPDTLKELTDDWNRHLTAR